MLTPRIKKWLFLAAKLLIVTLLVWFIRKTLVKAWDQIQEGEWELNYLWLAASAGFYIVGLVPAGWFWHRVLRDLGQEAGLGETLRAYCIGHLGKYVPGKAMVVVLRAGLVRSHRVHTGVAAASVFFETLTMMAAGSFWAAAVLSWRLFQGEIDLGPKLDPQLVLVGTLGMMLVSGIPTLPPVFRWLVRFFRIGKGDPEVTVQLAGLGYGTLAVGWLAMTVAWLLMGANLWATFRAMGLERLELCAQLPDYMAVMAVALVAGFLSMIPAGFGVRDLVLMQLNVYLFGINAGEAVVAAALIRVVWLLAELIVSGILYFAVRRNH